MCEEWNKNGVEAIYIVVTFKLLLVERIYVIVSNDQQQSMLLVQWEHLLNVPMNV
jgi:hypothetical protein